MTALLVLALAALATPPRAVPPATARREDPLALAAAVGVLVDRRPS